MTWFLGGFIGAILGNIIGNYIVRYFDSRGKGGGISLDPWDSQGKS